MFEDVGNKLKFLAKIVFGVNIIIAIILGLIVMSGSGNFLLGLLVMAVMFLTSVISAWFLYAFGELIDRTNEVEANTRKISITLDALLNSADKFGNTNTDNPSAEKTTPKASEPHRFACPECGKLISEYPCGYCGHNPIKVNRIPVRIYKDSDGDTTCPTCGKKQRGDRHVCFNCGQVFINKQPDIPYWCGNCGNKGPYEGNCPVCGSSLKLNND